MSRRTVGLLCLPLLLCTLLSVQSRAETLQRYQVEARDGNSLVLPEPLLPDISGYTREAIDQRLMAVRQSAQATPVIEIRRMFGEVTLDDFTAGERTREWAIRQYSNPTAIFVKSGLVTLEQLSQQLHAPEYFSYVGKGTYLARLPVVIEAGATLLLDQQETLHLSQQGGAFLVVAGKLFVRSSTIIGWDEKNRSPSAFKGKDQFRPFLTSWGGSEMYLLDSTFSSLGYDQSKSYGISVSQYSADINDELKLPSPVAWIIGSTFIDIYYGFYCYEARGLVLLRNQYIDNVVYGIDPHDRSSELIIGYNEVRGSHKKHGIIVSREVNNSWIFNNVSHDNNLSGIVIDRSSVDNVIANNISHNNLSDGITIYESPNNLLWGNNIYANGKHGIRMRNSTNISIYNNRILANSGYGVYGDVKDLSDTNRNTKLDPYDSKLSMVLYGGSLIANKAGPFLMDQPLSMEIFNVDMRFSEESLASGSDNVFFRFHTEILNILVRDKKAVVVRPYLEGEG